jgi:simple sugar transport system substrate-binding protein
MIRQKKTIAVIAMSMAAALSLAACSSGGREEDTSTEGGSGGGATTPEMTVAMITHQAPGDTFWDIIRKGAEAGAAKSNVKLEYSNDPDATKQAQLIQAAVDKKVDGIAVTDPNTPALGAAIENAVAAGIPVTMFNAGGNDAFALGAIGYFGQGEKEAGIGAGKKIVEEGGKSIVCVIQEQGQQQLYVNGRDDSAVTTSIQAKLTEDTSIDYVLTLGAQFALNAVKSVDAAGSAAKIGTFDTNKELVAAIKAGDVAFAIDQQPFLQGYLAVDALWLYKTNGNTLGGGANVATGPSFIDSTNIDAVSEFAANGTR